MPKKEVENKNRRSFSELLVTKTELPCDELSGDMRVELRGRNILFVHGCKRIVKYSADIMVLALDGADLCIEGERLVCSTYHAGVVSIEGFVCCVRFEERGSI